MLTSFPPAGSRLVSLRHPAFAPAGTFGGPDCSRQFVEPEEVQISVAQKSASKSGLFKLENGASVEAEEMAGSGGWLKNALYTSTKGVDVPSPVALRAVVASSNVLSLRSSRTKGGSHLRRADEDN